MGAPGIHAYAATGAYVVIDTLPTALALPAADVIEIVHATDWQSDPPIAFNALLPISYSSSEPTWVLTITGVDRPVPVRFSGAVRMSYLDPVSLLPMTSFRYRGFSNFSHLVLANGKPLALVVNMNVLFGRIAS